MKAHLVQFDIAWEDRPANLRKVRGLLSDAGVAPGDLVVLPEMFDTGFSLNIETTADTANESASFLAGLAREHACSICAGITAVGPDGRGRNRSLTIAPSGQTLCIYDKLHPFTYGREGERFSRGGSIALWDLPGAGEARVCPAICYDLRFPELFRAGLAGGASAYTVIANWPAGRREHWRALCIARAIENQAFVLGVNRCGQDPHLNYLGGSIAVDAQGHVLGEATAGESVVSVELDWGRLHWWRAEFPAWRDQSPLLWPPRASFSSPW